MVALSVGVLIVPLAVLWAIQGDELERAVSRFPVGALIAAALVHLTWLTVRAEAWRLSLNAIEHPVPRVAAHGASAAGYAAGAIQPASGLPVRAVFLRRLMPRSPSVDQILVSEAPVITLEGSIVASVFALSLLVAPALPRWIGVAALVGFALTLFALWQLSKRYSEHGAVAGLRVLADSDRRGALVGLALLMAALGILRAWIVLHGAGLPTEPAAVGILFAVLGILGALPLGPGASPGAMLTVFGPVSASAATVAGLAMVASSLIAVFAYCVLVPAALLIVRTLRTEADRVELQGVVEGTGGEG